jgi:hypothetical protein
MSRDEVLKIYKKLVSSCCRFELKGKTMPYTSANGHMFSQLNKDGEIGIRFSKEVQMKYMKEFKTDYFKSYSAILKGYILIPEIMFKDIDKMILLLNESYDYVKSIDSKLVK